MSDSQAVLCFDPGLAEEGERKPWEQASQQSMQLAPWECHQKAEEADPAEAQGMGVRGAQQTPGASSSQGGGGRVAR